MGNGKVQKKQDTGNVYFTPGLVKSINVKYETKLRNGALMGKDNTYFIELNDGTRLSYPKQKGTNMAKV